MNRHISADYEKELESLRTTLTTVGGLAEQQLSNAFKSFLTNDTQLASKVRNTELQINRFALELERQATAVIATRQPAAADLRLIVSIIKNCTDIERIGDEAERIAKLMDREKTYDSNRPFHSRLIELHTRVADALGASLDAFTRLDVDIAVKTIADDRRVDELYKDVLNLTTDEMSSSHSTVSIDLSVIWVARSLERISDHAKNICESVVYLVHGQNIVNNVL